MALQWYVGITQSMQWKKAEQELKNQGFEVYQPMCISGVGRRSRVRPFLAPYIFIRIDPEDPERRWRAVHATRGMSDRGLLPSSAKPEPVASWIIEQIKLREVNDLVVLKPREKCRYAKGDTVRLKGSPLDAVFSEAVDDRRAVIFVSLLGRPHRTIVPMARLTASTVQA